jgi:transposase
MAETTERNPSWTLGIDLGDRVASYCWIDAEGRTQETGEVPQTVSALSALCEMRGEPIRVAFEVGTHSGWVSDLLEQAGHQVFVANAHRMKLIAHSKRKTDRADAELLARIARSDPTLLCPIRHRGKEAREGVQLIRSRSILVESRAKLVNHVRGSVKAAGSRIPAYSAASFHKKAAEHLPAALRDPLLVILASIEQLSSAILEFDRRIRLACEQHPETQVLQQVVGVGDVTSLCFVLTIDDPARFSSSRRVGAYLGLTPKLNQSGARDPELGITKSGDALLRQLLVCAAHYIIGPFGTDSDLRTWGLKMASRGGKNAKKRAVIAVARKLAVLLHSLWRNGSVYEPLRISEHRRSKRRSA